MMMVRCDLAPSATGALGLYSLVDIRKGALVWLFDARFDNCYFREDLAGVPAPFRALVERYGFDHPQDDEMVVIDCDEGRFMTHDAAPNIDVGSRLRGIATRTIHAGEELTSDHALIGRGQMRTALSRSQTARPTRRAMAAAK